MKEAEQKETLLHEDEPELEILGTRNPLEKVSQ
jgi:hypothetical protein